ncbi:energy-coupling factor transporter ATPase [Lentilactobacillus kosonis]|uniref:ATPase component of general energizing module of ECF transporters n=1 Tax=Lentilactobacillus kosonis TaxID=2810561 RepID=A0A401FLM9_9LACO|nr:energy-coupling factor transporter ATPase [Lentilactobacillus kosonis]GAY73247.1 ATPase component of general energizing module of ECF transporters [Lentilactobacillus kosonis]
MENIIEISNLSFKYPDQDSLFNNLNLTIEANKWTAILGQNGSGKSTLARLVDGLLVPENGDIRVAGLKVNDENLLAVRSKIGLVFQNPEDQFVGATVEDDVAFGLENRRIERSEMQEIVKMSLKEVGMWEFRDRIPASLSGGQKQRVAIAGILAIKPQILILDESTSMLDPLGRQEIIQLVKDVKRGDNLTIISITHDIEEAALADRIVILDKGVIVTDTTPDSLLNQSEFLSKFELDTPFTTKLVAKLKTLGIDVPDKYMNDEELISWIKKSLFRM